MVAVFPGLGAGGAKAAVRFAEGAVSYRELMGVTAGLAAAIGGAGRVAVWATPRLSTCLAVVAALRAGVPAVPVNPKAGERELAHILADSAPDAVLAERDEELPAGFTGMRRIGVVPESDTAPRPDDDHDAEAPALIVYTSGTTGPPKGVVLPRRAITSNLDALATAWEWTGGDVLVHGLPLFHVHGLVLGVLGPLRLGGTVHHLGRFTPEAAAAQLAGDATMMFGVPTMYNRLAAEAEHDPDLAKAFGRARLLVSGSAALPATLHERIERLTGQRVVERYGMTETLMNCGVRSTGGRRPGYVGPPLDGVQVRLVDEDGSVIEAADDETVGEIWVRGPNLFTEYLNRPDATAEAMRDGWFVTGDMATVAPDGYVRIMGRKSTDLIKSGGFKIGAAEIENVLLDHPAVAEVAVTGEPDEDLGEHIVAWVVPAPGARPDERELVEHVAGQLTPHKRPRVVRFLDELPRNELGKVTKKRLGTAS
ncbi:MAG TPA: acyl-CoA synthetase [Pseudonocardiaceae bacterium]|nr:acyl-CoA synthetase [Pseudonocardiaceae bacterium]